MERDEAAGRLPCVHTEGGDRLKDGGRPELRNTARPSLISAPRAMECCCGRCVFCAQLWLNMLSQLERSGALARGVTETETELARDKQKR